MSKMGKYCKAYPIGRFREYGNWRENSENLRKDRAQNSGAGGEAPGQLTEDDFLYLQENYVVTDGIFIDENIIFDNITPEWINFCVETLKFEAPVYDNEAQQESKAEGA
jgi:hypothetical protein